jgi:hypothetical protein
VTSVTVGAADGTLTILYTGLSANICTNSTLQLQGTAGDGSVTWARGKATDIDNRCLPANLRQ